MNSQSQNDRIEKRGLELMKLTKVELGRMIGIDRPSAKVNKNVLASGVLIEEFGQGTMSGFWSREIV